MGGRVQDVRVELLPLGVILIRIDHLHRELPLYLQWVSRVNEGNCPML